MKNKCQDINLDLFLDDELSRSKKARVEAHLAGCSACRNRLEAFVMQAEILKEDLEAVADGVDFTGFEERVLSGIRLAEPPSVFERFRMWAAEAVYHYRTVWVTSLVTAAILIAVLVPLLGSESTVVKPAIPTEPGKHSVQVAAIDNEVIIDSIEYAGERSMIYTVSKNNTTVIWLYDFNGAENNTAGGDDI
ncbi:MAG: zf-HC2 domain-containing protein [Deltaproteobacteria bacterium]|nr:zf-HC2 domain-containing protein [Deltaproteobacteria bacterium]MBW1871456.1 zf-HC2 domain-containing protein [Deltaproteobacteria bacterium]